MDFIKVIFLVDMQCLLKDKFSADQLDLAFKRIAFFYHHHYKEQEKTILWGYRFFDSLTACTSNTPSTLYGLEEFEGLKERIDFERDKYIPSSPFSSGSSFIQLKQVLKELFGDFPWEANINFKNGNSDETQLEKHHVYTFMALPCNLPELRYFLTKNQIEDESRYTTFPEARDIVIDIKEDLVKTYADSFRQRQISFNLIDTDYKFNRSKTQAKLFDEFIGRGFQLCTQEFRGRYIIFNSLIQEYNNYGFHFYCEMQELLMPKPMVIFSPYQIKHDDALQQLKRRSQKKPYFQRIRDRELLSQQISAVYSNVPPLWKGSLKSFEGTKFGDVKIHPLFKDSSRIDPLAFSFCSHIEIQSSIHCAQFDFSWVSQRVSEDYENAFMMSIDFDYSNGHLFLDYLAALFANHQVGIAERVLFEGAGGLPCIMYIEPMTKGCAAVRFLNIPTLPKIEPLQVAYDRDVMNIVVEKMSLTRLNEALLSVAQDNERERKPLNLKPSDSVLSSIMEFKRQKKKTDIDDTKSKKTEDRKVIRLPKDIPSFKKSLESLYYETLYERVNYLEGAVAMVDNFIKHIAEKKETKIRDILHVMESIALNREILESKHTLKIKNAKEWARPLTIAKEDMYIYEWWERTKENSPERESENESLLLLKVTDARLNAILFCFMACLLKQHSPEDNGIQIYLDHAFELYEIPHYHISALDIAQRTDEDVDEVDKSDYNYLRLLEAWFKKDIPELINTLYESFYEEELVPSTLMAGLDLNHALKTYYEKEPEKLERSKASKKSLSDLLKEEKASKMKKKSVESLFKTVPVLPKRNPVPQISEAAQEAIDKVKRTMVDGKPTMKRAGAFLVSAASPKKTKLPHKKEIELSITPRTTLNRLLGANVFKDYAEEFPNEDDEFNIDEFF